MLKLAKGAAMLGAIAILSACGQNNMADAFKNIKVSNIDENGNAIVELKTEVGTANLLFSDQTLPITDPKTGKNYGTITMARTADGKNLLTVSANISGLKLANVLPDNKLPNGKDVPIAGLTSLVAVPAGTNSRVYIGETTTGVTLVVGAAIAVKEFDNFVTYIPNANVFSTLVDSSGVKGSGGFFTSSESGKNGIAIFVETARPAGLPIPGLPHKVLATNSNDVKFMDKNPTNEQKNYFGYFINRWSKAKTALNIK